jgi:hypothetical protein
MSKDQDRTRAPPTLATGECKTGRFLTTSPNADMRFPRNDARLDRLITSDIKHVYLIPRKSKCEEAENSIAAVRDGSPRLLVEEALARHRTAKARNTVVAVHFTLELVVVREFLLCQTN